MKPTPGPWTVDSDRPSGQLVIVSEFGEVAQVFGGDNPDDETIPNARLIAAAPDLLEACKALQAEAAERNCGLRIADEAIAKAEGGQ